MEQERRAEIWSSIRRRELSCEAKEMAHCCWMGFEESRGQTEAEKSKQERRYGRRNKKPSKRMQEEERQQNLEENRIFDLLHWKKDKAAEDGWRHAEDKETGEGQDRGECAGRRMSYFQTMKETFGSDQEGRRFGTDERRKSCHHRPMVPEEENGGGRTTYGGFGCGPERT